MVREVLTRLSELFLEEADVAFECSGVVFVEIEIVDVTSKVFVFVFGPVV